MTTICVIKTNLAECMSRDRNQTATCLVLCLPGVEYAVYGIPQVLLGRREDREAGQHQHRHLGLEDGLQGIRERYYKVWQDLRTRTSSATDDTNTTSAGDK